MKRSDRAERMEPHYAVQASCRKARATSGRGLIVVNTRFVFEKKKRYKYRLPLYFLYVANAYGLACSDYVLLPPPCRLNCQLVNPRALIRYPSGSLKSHALRWINLLESNVETYSKFFCEHSNTVHVFLFLTVVL